MRSGFGTRAASYVTLSPRSIATRVYVAVDQCRIPVTSARFPLRFVPLASTLAAATCSTFAAGAGALVVECVAGATLLRAPEVCAIAGSDEPSPAAAR